MANGEKRHDRLAASQLTLGQDKMIGDISVEDIHLWMLADVTLSGRTCIAFMLHKAAVLESESLNPIMDEHNIPEFTVAVRASRNFLQVLDRLYKKWSTPNTVLSLFGTFRAHVHFACLAKHCLHERISDSLMVDLSLLDSIAGHVMAATYESKDLAPLAHAMLTLCKSVRSHLHNTWL
jgi:hypothetical protein